MFLQSVPSCLAGSYLSMGTIFPRRQLHSWTVAYVADGFLSERESGGGNSISRFSRFNSLAALPLPRSLRQKNPPATQASGQVLEHC